MMKKFYKKIQLILISALFILVGCNYDPAPSLFPEEIDNGEPAVITSVSPADLALAGITEITINGSNFSPNQSENNVYFNSVRATIISSSATQIVVKAPILVSDSIKIKIAKRENISNAIPYKLRAGVDEFFPFDPNNGQLPVGFTFDNTGNMIVSLSGLGIKKITPAKVLSDFIPKGAETKWDALRVFSNGDIYGAKSIRGIWKLAANVAPPSPPWALTAAGTSLKDFDFDTNFNLWAVGSNSVLFRIKLDGTHITFPFTASLRAVRVFNNALYVAGLKSGVEGIWKLTIDGSGNLGTEELYFDLTTNYPGVVTNAMTFSQDGDLFLGTNKDPDPIIIVHPNKSHESLYPGVLKAKEVLAMYWPQGNNFYITRKEIKDEQLKVILSQTIIRVDVQKPGAQYFVQ